MTKPLGRGPGVELNFGHPTNGAISLTSVEQDPHGSHCLDKLDSFAYPPGIDAFYFCVHRTELRNQWPVSMEYNDESYLAGSWEFRELPKVQPSHSARQLASQRR